MCDTMSIVWKWALESHSSTVVFVICIYIIRKHIAENLKRAQFNPPQKMMLYSNIVELLVKGSSSQKEKWRKRGQIQSVLMSLFGHQLCVCWWLLKSIRNQLEVSSTSTRMGLWYRVVHLNLIFSPARSCKAIKHHMSDAWRSQKNQTHTPTIPWDSQQPVWKRGLWLPWSETIWCLSLC